MGLAAPTLQQFNAAYCSQTIAIGGAFPDNSLGGSCRCSGFAAFLGSYRDVGRVCMTRSACRSDHSVRQFIEQVGESWWRRFG